VVIYPEGTTTKEPDLWPMRAKTGVARLWLATGAPVIPVANWGAHTIYDPRTGRLKIRPRTRVSVSTAPPIDLSRWQDATPTRAVLEQMTDAIMLEVQDLVGERRGEQPPAGLYDRPANRAAASGEA
jgi:1-acyl-sn-glycerol-3-phosphate acyltransferase